MRLRLRKLKLICTIKTSGEALETETQVWRQASLASSIFGKIQGMDIDRQIDIGALSIAEWGSESVQTFRKEKQKGKPKFFF